MHGLAYVRGIEPISRSVEIEERVLHSSFGQHHNVVKAVMHALQAWTVTHQGCHAHHIVCGAQRNVGLFSCSMRMAGNTHLGVLMVMGGSHADAKSEVFQKPLQCYSLLLRCPVLP